MARAGDIRTLFLDYFGARDHELVPSSPLVPRNDPSLLFTNAGMVPFKNVFTGQEERAIPRAASSQKCVRAGGKHNDLENVGYTARHHTFFEMLGNFSFGDYFKAEAIELAWKLVTDEMALPIDRLLITVFIDDDEAFDLWRKISGLPEDRIIRIAGSDNFWQMGDTGPCGPCSEIFYDHGAEIPGGPPGSAEEDGDRFIEIWNLVFMQYDQQSDGTRRPLPKPSIDTGMGLERISAVLQGKHNNYDIDLFRALIEASADASNTDPDGAQAVSHRVIADHLRAAAFLIADGVLPSNEGRGYVLRRIMRRGMRHAHLLGARDPLMHRLVGALNREMGEAFPELLRAAALIEQTLLREETRFKQTLDRGLKLLDEAVEMLPGDAPLAGETAFKLYDTYGFPLDLTQDVLRGRGRSVDTAGFDAAMAKQKAEARKAWAGSGEAVTETLWFAIRDRLPATEFLGYDAERADGRVDALIRDGAEVDSVEAGQDVLIVTNQTPFYGESGGQIGDVGVLSGADNVKITITDTQKQLSDLFVHHGHVESGRVAVGDILDMQVDSARRGGIRANHSATHLLHEALRRELGDHVAQKGSLVAGNRLRFDISHHQPLSAEEISAVEAEVNAHIRMNTPVETRLMDMDSALEAGALALFGEKYGDEVRVVAMGGPGETGRAQYSVELCGGTHVARTGDIGLFKIISDSAVSAGVRRIEALTGAAAFDFLAGEQSRLAQTAALLKSAPADVPDRIAGLLEERRKMEKELSELRRKLATGGGNGGGDIRQVAGIGFAPRVLDGVPAKELKPLADDLKSQIGSGVVALIAGNDGKASIVVGVTDDLTARISAVDLVRLGSEALGGKGGGGRPDMAQAGGPDASRAEAAIAAIEQALQALDHAA